MLKKQNRLRGEKDFEKIIKKGERFWDIFLFLKVIKNNLRIVRVGLVISRKVSKKAVVRNKIKRQMRAILRSFLSTLKGGGSLIFIAKKSLLDSNYHELERDIRTLLSKSKLV